MSVFRVDGQQILPWTFETQMRLEKQLVKFWGGTKGKEEKGSGGRGWTGND